MILCPFENYHTKQIAVVTKLSYLIFSLFQIDDNRRIELDRDRMLAMEVERRLQLKCTESVEQCKTDGSHVSDADETLVKDAVECSVSNYDTSAAVESLLDDNISTLKEDDERKESEKDEEAEAKTDRDYENMLTPEKPHESEIEPNTKPVEIPQLSLNIDSNFNTYDEDNLSPSFSLHSSPSLGALDESRNQSLYFTPMSSREAFSPRPRQELHLPSPRLIRSNSYTLDKPSPLLLKHMEINGIPIDSHDSSMKSPMSLNEFRKNQSSTPSNIPRKSLGGNVKQLKTTQYLQIPTNRMSLGPNTKLSSLSSNASSNATIAVPSSKSSIKSSASKSTQVQNGVQSRKKSNNQTTSIKSKETVLRSIYGSVKPAKVQNSVKKVNRSAHIQPPSVESISQNVANGNLNGRNIGEVLSIIEKQHADHMKALLKRQHEEQRRMQEEFSRQQDELLKMISNLVLKKGEKQSTPNGRVITPNSNGTKKSNEKMLIEEVNNEVPVIYDANGNRVNRFTPPENSKCIRRLLYDDNKLVRSEIDIDKSSLSSLSISTLASEQIEAYSIEEVQAVITIQAYARGYLTRRLMKTSRVKEIKKTHYDTLALLLDICEEKTENESKSDVEFKFHLLQQVK